MKRIKLLTLAFVITFMFSIFVLETTSMTETNAAAKKVSNSQSYIVSIINSKKAVNVYASAKTSSKVLGSVVTGAQYNVIKANYSSKWHKISFKGKTGYIQKAYTTLTKKSSQNTKVTSPVSGDTNTPTPSSAPSPSGDTTSPADSANPGDGIDTKNPIDNNSWAIDNNQFGIDNTGKNARATTDGINKALKWAKEQGYKKVSFANGTYLIQCKWNNRYIAPTDGILVPSGLTLDLGTSTFVMEPNGYPEYCIFAMVNQSDITITGGTLIGDLGKHVYTDSEDSPTHEWGFGIITSASKNVLIKGVTIKNMTGDGIILEGSFDSLANGGNVSSQIKVFDCDISNCRRQGISVIGAPDSEIARNKIYNINGTDPQYGIDVETEFDYNVDNLKIHNNTIYGCTGGAIACSKGSNFEVYENTCIGNNILAYKSTDVKIYNNTIKNSFIRVMNYAKNVTVNGNTLDSKSWVFFG